MDRYKKTSHELSSLIELVIKAMFGIVIVYMIAQTLLETIAETSTAKVISAIIGIALLFAVVVSKRVREEILEFGKKK